MFNLFRKHTALWIGAVVLAVVIFASLALQVNAANPLVRPDPPSLGLKSGDQGTISIRIDDVENMYGVEFHLQFDPSIVEVVDADATKPGVQIKSGDWLKNTFVASNKADNATGKIDYAVTLLNPAPAVTGGGVVATITFKAKSNGNSPLKIQKAIIASRDGKEIKSSWQDGAIGVSPIGIAPSVNQTTRSGDQSSQSSDTTQALPLQQIALLGLAGFGVLAFLGAIVVGAIAVVVLRRR